MQPLWKGHNHRLRTIWLLVAPGVPELVPCLQMAFPLTFPASLDVWCQGPTPPRAPLSSVGVFRVGFHSLTLCPHV